MEAPSSRFRELARVKLEKEPSSVEEHHHPVAKSEPKSTDRPDPDPDPKGHPSNHKPQPAAPTPPSSTGKRPNEEAGVGGSNKKSRIPWSDEDEITVLNGMIDFRSRNGPTADFYDFIKGKLQVGVSKMQLKGKKSRLKERFLNNCESGSDPVFSDPHEEIVFQLSKKIWGYSDGSKKKKRKKKVIERKAKEPAANRKEVAKEDKNGEKTEFLSKYPALNESFHKMGNFSPSFSMSESGLSFVKERLSLIGSAKAKKLDIKWRELIVKEMEIKSKQVEINDQMFALMTEQFKMAFDH